MLIAAAMKAFYEVVAESIRLRRELAKRYPNLLAE